MHLTYVSKENLLLACNDVRLYPWYQCLSEKKGILMKTTPTTDQKCTLKLSNLDMYPSNWFNKIS